MQKWREQTAKDGYRTEQARLEGQHEILIHHMGKAVYAPVDFNKEGLMILDTGCANGRWLRDLEKSLPTSGHEFYGADINDTVFPSDPPASMHFSKQDIKDEFPDSWEGKFDLVHQRLSMTGAAPGTPAPVIKRFVKLLRPGGWLQLVEPNVQNVLNNGPLMTQCINMLKTISVASGLGPGAVEFRALMCAAGLNPVEEKPVTVKYGAALNDRDLAEKSVTALCAAIAPLSNVLRTVSPDAFKHEELQDFDTRLRQELEARGGSIQFLVVYGQKGVV